MNIPGVEIIGKHCVRQGQLTLPAYNINKGRLGTILNNKSCLGFSIPHSDSKNIETSLMGLDHRGDGNVRIGGGNFNSISECWRVEHRRQLLNLKICACYNTEHLGIAEESRLVEAWFPLVNEIKQACRAVY